ncbi:MAG: NAD+ synthase [Bacteroidetes bacterium]|nr:NAD+ synthase [Bacteroidota bacterium]
MKIALAQINTRIGDFEANLSKILSCISRAKSEGADLVVFPELIVCGYPPLDFLEFEDFVKRSQIAVRKIADACHGIAAIVGAPDENPVPEGKNLFNAAFFLQNGRVESVVHKTLLPTYDVFDEYRYFEPNHNVFECITCKGKKIALTICEDLWDIEEDKMYTLWPMDKLVVQKPDLMINIAASPFSYGHDVSRKRVLHKAASDYGLPLFYVNHVGAQTELIFDGGSMVLNRNGNIVCELNYFEEDFRIFDLGHINTAPAVDFKLASAFRPEEVNIEAIHRALILGVRDYFSKLGFKKAILGLSGGIDSAVVYALAVEALGKDKVLGVLMPSQYSSDHSISDALLLAKNLGAATETIPIQPAFKELMHSLEHGFAGKPADVTEENIQARIRGVLLMALSNKHGYILLNTSNKSEAAVGYGTLYGDMCGGISVIGDLYKTHVYSLARHINRDKEVIPENILLKAPSAELRPDQKDSDSLPEYDILDEILYQYIEQRLGPAEITAKGYDAKLVARILKMVNTNEYKRYQTPPVLRVSPKAFGLGRRMPIVGHYLS